ncbi:ECF transporter S component [Ruania halotolerans]|uniref:ECF transporter S component n=1 Tax=Ruania halotolerans TaxID=2897773 RepID=UPI001E5FC2A9|nr:ECF transporter S component [Ruania halotolerans]UFU07711.1 ECF transporter S component [Ruania halotolerans]
MTVVSDRPWLAARAVPVGPRLTVSLVLVSAVGLLAFAWPLLVDAGAVLDGDATAPLVLGVVLGASLLVVATAVSDGGMDVRAVAMLGLLAAVGALIRPLAAGTGGVETVFVLLVLGGRVFGPGFGFLLGGTTLFASALLTGGVGPWLPYQMLGAAWVGLGAGLLPHRIGWGRAQVRVRGVGELVLLATYGALASVLFGIAMNLSFWPFLLGAATEISFIPGAAVTENLHRFLTYSVVTSLPWDLTRAVTTVLGVAVAGHAVLVTLRRAARRAVFVA